MDRRFVLGDAEREQFEAWIRHYEVFCGVRVVTCSIMSNPFHILVEVPQRPETQPSDEVPLGWLERDCSKWFAHTIPQRLETLPEDKRQALRENFLLGSWR